MIGLVVFVLIAMAATYFAGWVAALVFGVLAGLMLIAALFERWRWNKGYCNCGKPWRMFDMDSQGGRMYKCDECGAYVDISYPFVDGMVG